MASTPRQARPPIKVGAAVAVEGVPAEREWMWAQQISENTAKLSNIPFFVRDMAIGDLVRFDPQTMLVEEVIEHTGRTLHASFDGAETQEESLALWQQVVRHFLDYDIKIEGFQGGFFACGLPLDVDDDMFRSICSACPVPVTPYFD